MSGEREAIKRQLQVRKQAAGRVHIDSLSLSLSPSLSLSLAVCTSALGASLAAAAAAAFYEFRSLFLLGTSLIAEVEPLLAPLARSLGRSGRLLISIGQVERDLAW